MTRMLLAGCLLIPMSIQAQSHFFSGRPACDDLHERIAYTMCYDETRRVAKWVAYRVEPEIRDTPERRGKFKSVRMDPDVANPVVDNEHTGLFNIRGYAHGHFAPYAAMGRHRDDDGQTAEDCDADDELTIFRANFMSNIAPQHRSAFNGSGGLWFDLEWFVQDELVDDSQVTVWVYAGTVFGAGPVMMVGPDDDIHSPPMFYKIVTWQDPYIDEAIVLAVLFPHQRDAHGDIDDYLVSVDVNEALTDHDLFAGLAGLGNMMTMVEQC